MGRSRHRDALPTPMKGVSAALVVSSVLALVLVVVGSGALLRAGLVLCLVLAVGAAAFALTSGRRSVSIARAEVSRERAARMREVETLQRRIREVQDAERALSVRLDREGARIAGLRADVLRSQRSSELMRPTLVLPLLAEAMRRSAPVPLARVRVPLDDAAAVAMALAPRVDHAGSPEAASLPGVDGVDVRTVDVRTLDERAVDGEPVAVTETVAAAEPVAPAVTVLGEFSLIGLAAFPRPAGMPDPGLPLVAPQVVDLTDRARADEAIIDVRGSQARSEQAGA